MQVTMQDIARKAGVSTKTVSNVVNNYPYIKDATRSRVLAAIDELGYQVNSSARNLRSGRTGMISLAIPELKPYFAELAQSVIDEADQCGLTVLIETFGSLREGELKVLNGRRRQIVDGMIFSPLTIEQADIDKLAIDIPLVLLGERVRGGRFHHVTMSNVRGASAAVSHLVSVGCRRIGAVGSHPGEEFGTAALRLQGYAAALETAGLPFAPELVRPAGPWHRASGRSAVEEMIDDGVAFDGIFFFNDDLALGGMRELLRRGVKIPDDVALVGFDDTEEAAFSTPSLTSISPGRSEIAHRAVRLVTELIEGQSPPSAEEVVVDFHLSLRESSDRRPPR